MRYMILFIFMMDTLFAAKVVERTWKKGETFSQYLESYHIPLDLLKSISKDDHKLLSKMNVNSQIYESLDDENVLLQALIPINKVMQIHLAKLRENNSYTFEIIPIESEKNEYFAKVKLQSNLYTDTLATIHNKMITKNLLKVLKVLDGTNIHIGTTIAFFYDQRTRIGKPYLKPEIKIVRVFTGKKEKYIYVDEKGEGYTQVHKSVAYTTTEKRRVTYSKLVPVSRADSLFRMPLRHVRITSNFSLSRWHPILQLYRPHHGTDFGARSGTPLLAVNRGRVSFAGPMGTYGNVVKIRHGDGYESLYAHQSSIRARVGEVVKRGQIIGYVGNTGRSTGPHLHFGLMKNGRWIDPMTVLNKISLKLFTSKKFSKYGNVNITKYKTVAIKGVKENKAKLLHYIQKHTPSYVWGE